MQGINVFSADLLDTIGITALCFCLSQIIDEQVLCVHGGLSPDIKTLDQV